MARPPFGIVEIAKHKLPSHFVVSHWHTPSYSPPCIGVFCRIKSATCEVIKYQVFSGKNKQFYTWAPCCFALLETIGYVNIIKIGQGSFPITGIQPSYCPCGNMMSGIKNSRDIVVIGRTVPINVLGIKGVH